MQRRAARELLFCDEGNVVRVDARMPLERGECENEVLNDREIAAGTILEV